LSHPAPASTDHTVVPEKLMLLRCRARTKQKCSSLKDREIKKRGVKKV